ncbi:autotransporter outer membrane beta-barrel domain-containing protein [Pseudochrobactrum sp. sp1633]|uniref:autotransporter family protein n=1 Tax=Pseudochrobactrum sp. sp1633 TaxID=3036706 RepID=UPI0025A590DE|nr:autotransporter outer membrane beta-barrel domain-containing protein [Pseudochrobactrum sp. sp1633]MDM8344781.1 autotransporter outer membrane beta-barrel domain-containing protein [Pseudochrobactrum sp. sp1633]HWD13458.1 autotransporter outer membrane beta-barrel domain-containing protein [Pseudochrobactrum sp.]
MTIENDFTTTVKGAVGISVYGTSPDFTSTFDASGKTINLTIENTDANSAAPAGDNIAKNGVGVTHGGTVRIGTLNLKMLNLPSRGVFEHYGVVAGSTNNAGETSAFNGMRSRALFDNLDIKMQSGPYVFGYPLLVGIRAIQGAHRQSGNGSAGYVEVKGDLAIDIDAASNDAIGIYVSGSEQNRRVPEVRLNNSNIKIKSTSGRANAIRLGKTADVGTGEGRLTSLGRMEIDTTAAANSSAIAVIWQGAVLDANTDASSTTIAAGREAISISGNFNQSNAQTDTMFNNLVASTTSTTANLVEVASNQQNYLLTVRGSRSLLTAASGGYLLNVDGISGQPSITTFNFSEGTMLGLTNKAAVSTLNLNLDQKAKWVLQEKTGSAPSTTAVFTKLDLKNASEVVAYGSGGAPAAFTLQGDIDNIGGILNLSDSKTGDQLILRGQYVGSQGAVAHLDTFLGASGSASDMIVNDGSAISGQTLLHIKNTGTDADGTDTEPGHGIKLVNSINGGTTTADAFMLDASATNAYQFNDKTVVGAGAYAYSLYRGPNAKSSSASDEYSDSEIADDWYLRSQLDKKDPEPQFTQGVPVYEAYPQILLALNSLPTLQQRVGNRYWSNAGNIMIEQGADVIGTPAVPAAEAGSFTERNGIWGRIEGQHLKSKPAATTSGTQYDADIFKMQAGLDGVLTETDNGLLIGGITVHYGHASADTRSEHGLGKISVDGYGFGGTLTWYGNNGFYVDTQAQATWYDSDLSTRGGSAVSLVDGNNGFGYALSAETGKRIALNDRWSVTPQAQLIYSNVDFDNFTDQYNGAVSLHKGDSLQGRIGVSADYQNSWYNDKGMINRSYVYGIANLYYEFLDGSAVDVSSVRFASRNDRFWGGIGLGGSYNWDNDKYSIYGEGAVNTSLNNFGDSYAYKGTIGLRVKW